MVHMLRFLKLIKFRVLFHFMSSNQSEIVIWDVYKASFYLYIIYILVWKWLLRTWLPSQNKCNIMQHARCNMLVSNRLVAHVAHSCCTFNLYFWSKIKTWRIWERYLMMRKCLYQISKKWSNKNEFL